MVDRPRVALVLGAGGVKGWAHVGVLKVLHQAGLPIDLVVGVSAGALIAPLYAARRDASAMERIARSASPFNLAQWFLQGLRVSPEAGAFGRRLWEAFGHLSFADLAVPFAAIALDVATGERVVLHQGPVAPAVEASIRTPAIMPTVEIDDRHLTDGGLHNTLPLDIAYGLGAQRIIGVNVGEFIVLPRPLRPFPATVARACRMLGRTPNGLLGQMAFLAELLSLGPSSRPQPDVLIQPELRGITSILPLRMTEAISRGEAAARQALPFIRQALADLKP